MDIKLKPGKYIVAVSGGVDSVCLLALLSKVANMQLVVAHFDHGIRNESAEDRKFVHGLAKKYGLPFEYAEGRLGPDTGEAEARAARYNFLHEVIEKHQARAIITAHHADDALETAIINLLRGTGRKGLSSLSNNNKLERPLLDVSKQSIIDYARQHDLEWREDPTNKQEIYLRNYIRHQLLSRFDEQDKQKLLDIVKRSKLTNEKLDDLLAGELRRHTKNGNLDRQWFNQLPHDIALEVAATWLRQEGIRGFDSRTLERLVVAAKVASAGHQFDALEGVIMQVGRNNLALQGPER